MAVVHDVGRKYRIKDYDNIWISIKRFIRRVFILIGDFLVIFTVLNWLFFGLGLLNRALFHTKFLEMMYKFFDNTYAQTVFHVLENYYHWIESVNIGNILLQIAFKVVTFLSLFLIPFAPGIAGMVMIWIGGLINTDGGARGNDVLHAGDAGEAMALRTVRRLSNRYHVFVNLEFELRGHHETDLIIVGPEGVCVCEVKYWKGKVFFYDNDEDDDDDNSYRNRSIVHREFSNGSVESPYSPRNQVMAHYETLHDALKKQGVDVPTNGMVLMMYPGVKIIDEENARRIPVLKRPCAWKIRSHIGNQHYSAREVDKIVAALEKIAL